MFVFKGPQIDAESQQKILKYIKSANDQGAKLEIGGKKWGQAGFFVEPTIFSNVTDNMTIAQEEVNIFVDRNHFTIIIICFLFCVDFRTGSIDSKI